MSIALCPVCDRDLVIPGKPVIGQNTVCAHCQAKLYVVWQDPLELDLIEWAVNQESVTQRPEPRPDE